MMPSSSVIEAQMVKEGPTSMNRERTLRPAQANIKYLMPVRKRDLASDLGLLS